MATTYSLPEEIIFIVLSLLPVESLVRFSLVCKSWQSIISSTQFIQTHLNNSEKKQPSSVLNCQYSDKAVYVDTREDSVKIPLPQKFDDYNVNICSCNGLVCLTGFSKYIGYIWNPSTRRIKILPAPNKRSIYFEPGVGFGFDPVSGDYKILRLVRRSDDSDSDSFPQFVIEAELYSTSTDSWKDISVPETLKRFHPFRPSKCVCTKNGVVYVEGIDVLLSFDLKNEQFGVHRYPPHSTVLRKSRIFEIDGSVAMIDRKNVKDEGSVPSLWMLEDVGGRLSWTEKFDLNIIHEKDYAVPCLNLGVGQYVALNDDGYLYYDYGSGKEVNEKFDPPRECTSIINYTESLVSLKGFEKQE
ncbi:hypothetical protein POM88_047354 [Heracleum sosnowskyi]|uniref:F-box domain-containing protein n=1 Tax=Heracleum sosnowskyi TaxID=360622 RepID=A0AAD8GT77_9APIA|nr:hypothetical protein POM88_047354 [Heracleum sosnowskyi]